MHLCSELTLGLPGMLSVSIFTTYRGRGRKIGGSRERIRKSRVSLALTEGAPVSLGTTLNHQQWQHANNHMSHGTISHGTTTGGTPNNQSTHNYWLTRDHQPANTSTTPPQISSPPSHPSTMATFSPKSDLWHIIPGELTVFMGTNPIQVMLLPPLAALASIMG